MTDGATGKPASSMGNRPRAIAACFFAIHSGNGVRWNGLPCNNRAPGSSPKIRSRRDRLLNIRKLRILFAATVLATCGIYGMNVQAQHPAADRSAQTDATIPSEAVLQPAELVHILNSSPKPLV